MVNIIKKMIQFFIIFLQILQKIRFNRKNPKNLNYSRRLPSELIDELLKFWSYEKCLQLSNSSRNFSLRSLANYRAEKILEKVVNEEPPLPNDPLSAFFAWLSAYFNGNNRILLLERRVKQLESENKNLKDKIKQLEDELQKLKSTNQQTSRRYSVHETAPIPQSIRETTPIPQSIHETRPIHRYSSQYLFASSGRSSYRPFNYQSIYRRNGNGQPGPSSR